MTILKNANIEAKKKLAKEFASINVSNQILGLDHLKGQPLAILLHCITTYIWNPRKSINILPLCKYFIMKISAKILKAQSPTK